MTVIDRTGPRHGESGIGEAEVPGPGSPALSRLVEAIAAGAEARDRGEGRAGEAIDLLRAARLGAFRLPRQDGGGGASLTDLFELVLDLAEADSNIPHILRNHFAFVEKALRTADNPKYARWLGHVRDGRIIGLGVSELGIQNIGLNDGDTRLEPSGTGYVLNGRKYYSTGNFYSDFILVNARTPDGRTASAFVPTSSEGVTVDDDWDGIGQRLTASGTTVLSRVPVARDDVLFGADEDVRLPFRATFAQLYLTAIVAGILRAVVADAAALVAGRERNYYHAVAARPADDPLLQQVVGRLSSAAYVAEAAVLRAVDALDAAFRSAVAGPPDQALFVEAALRTAKSKVMVDELALDAATRLFEVGGASAIRAGNRLDRHWRNIRTLSSHNPNAYKARAIGDHAVNGTPLPTAAFF
ncbi:acyl-CoA dehydrogenase family protein [Azospirillum sp. YIM B02556]|uniref:Dibenzothiophene monooxygenase n=1 Tax=Azospirillum endophyticum TaxID=2800326 RepID=A0ABS1EXN1_9PROT|nr:acyl-CoA dehydrogenase family protein [Azospirillum endophyticum]MBK1835926.1 acyl-CoA dehydrogenase family protein [Azospirillum endophyticum]